MELIGRINFLPPLTIFSAIVAIIVYLRSSKYPTTHWSRVLSVCLTFAAFVWFVFAQSKVPDGLQPWSSIFLGLVVVGLFAAWIMSAELKPVRGQILIATGCFVMILTVLYIYHR